MIDLKGFDVLIEKFLSRKLSVLEFEREFIDKFHQTGRLGVLFEPLNWLFSEVDCYTDMPLDPDENPAFYVTEEQLRESAEKVLLAIRSLK